METKSEQIIIRRLSPDWITGGYEIVKKCPFHVDGKPIETIEDWAIYVTTVALCRDLTDQLFKLLRQASLSPGSWSVRHIDGGHLAVKRELNVMSNHITVELSMTLGDSEND